MPVYLITDVEVTDPEQYKHYTRAGHDAAVKHGGRFLVEGGTPSLVEGSWLPRRMAIVEFPTREAALRFYHSEEYTRAREKREHAAIFNMILVDGVRGSAEGGSS